MSELAQDRGILGGLHLNREVAAELGILFGEFGGTEAILIKILSTALAEGDDSRLANKILGVIQSVTVRLDVTKGCIEGSGLDADKKAKCLAAVEKLRTMNSLRNEYTHAIYETHPVTGVVHRMTWAMSGARKGTAGQLTVAQLRTDCQRVRTVMREIITSLFSTEMTPFQPEQ
jgi:hypothetical protein